MTEIAFLVKPDSEMYRKYFKQKNELDKFVGFASAFIDKYFASRNKDFDYSFSTNMRLTVKLPPNDEEWFGAQLMKEKTEKGLCVFKKNSPMNKRWHEEVTSHINPDSLTASRWWFMDFPYCGKCQIAMWDDGCGNVYGYYSTQAAHHNSGKLPDYVQPIKMSEYYIAQERCKELDSLCQRLWTRGAAHLISAPIKQPSKRPAMVRTVQALRIVPAYVSRLSIVQCRLIREPLSLAFFTIIA